eukprot:Amastigsp_a340893_26.p6 type:complete len:118 gc:universal Amastigsp_a340893_26:1177-1530(+)
MLGEIRVHGCCARFERSDNYPEWRAAVRDLVVDKASRVVRGGGAHSEGARIAVGVAVLSRRIAVDLCDLVDARLRNGPIADAGRRRLERLCRWRWRLEILLRHQRLAVRIDKRNRGF